MDPKLDFEESKEVAEDNGATSLRLVHEPTVYLIGRQVIDQAEVDRFLAKHGTSWQTDSEVGAELICELGGRVCYMSFGKRQGRKTSRDYLENILRLRHGSVLEHAVWNLLVEGVSRSLTHELIRHRAGFGYSQLSQRYVDESDAEFVVPDLIAKDEELMAVWQEAIAHSLATYRRLCELLSVKVEERFPEMKKTYRRKLVRQTARSVLPNATETKILITANARALRHFIEMRAAESADREIRVLAVKVLEIMQREAPNIFFDFEIYTAADGAPAARPTYSKV